LENVSTNAGCRNKSCWSRTAFLLRARMSYSRWRGTLSAECVDFCRFKNRRL
jgi:hypothetical protein